MFDAPDHSSDFSLDTGRNATVFRYFLKDTLRLIVVATSTAMFVVGCWTMAEALR